MPIGSRTTTSLKPPMRASASTTMRCFPGELRRVSQMLHLAAAARTEHRAERFGAIGRCRLTFEQFTGRVLRLDLGQAYPRALARQRSIDKHDHPIEAPDGLAVGQQIGKLDDPTAPGLRPVTMLLFLFERADQAVRFVDQRLDTLGCLVRRPFLPHRANDEKRDGRGGRGPQRDARPNRCPRVQRLPGCGRVRGGRGAPFICVSVTPALFAALRGAPVNRGRGCVGRLDDGDESMMARSGFRLERIEARPTLNFAVPSILSTRRASARTVVGGASPASGIFSSRMFRL